jgi:glycerol uptake facilitator-like aquaporin
VSGAHLSPAVTIALAARRGFPWAEVPSYIVAQVFGAFAGALLVYVVYKGAIDSYERANDITPATRTRFRLTRSLPTFPAPYFKTVIGPLIDQIVGTAFLVCFIFALTDEFNQPVRANVGPDRGRVRRGPGSACRSATRSPEGATERLLAALSSGRTPGTRSTPRATSGRGCSRGSAGWAKVAIPTATPTATCGYRSSGPSSAASSGPTPTTSRSATSHRAGEEPAPVEERGRTVEDKA